MQRLERNTADERFNMKSKKNKKSTTKAEVESHREDVDYNLSLWKYYFLGTLNNIFTNLEDLRSYVASDEERDACRAVSDSVDALDSLLRKKLRTQK